MIIKAHFFLRCILIILCAGLPTRSQGMEQVSKLLSFLNPFGAAAKKTLAERIAHAIVAKSRRQLMELLLQGYDINQTCSEEFLLEVTKHIKNLVKKGYYRGPKRKQASGFYASMNHSCLFLGFWLVERFKLADWLVCHGYRPDVANPDVSQSFCGGLTGLEKVFVFGSEEEVLNKVKKAIRDLRNERNFENNKVTFIENFIKQIIFLAAAQGRTHVLDLIINLDERLVGINTEDESEPHTLSELEMELEQLIKDYATGTSTTWVITNNLLAQALMSSSLPGQTQTARVILNILTKRLILGVLTKQELTHIVRRSLTWACVQGRIETVKMLLDNAQMLDLEIGWVPLGDRVAAILEDNSDLDDQMRVRLDSVLDLLSDYALQRRDLIRQRGVPFEVARHNGLAEEIAVNIARFI